MLPPSGEVVSAQGARTIMRHKDAGVPNSQIAGMVGTSESTVRKVVQAPERRVGHACRALVKVLASL